MSNIYESNRLQNPLLQWQTKTSFCLQCLLFSLVNWYLKYIKEKKQNETNHQTFVFHFILPDHLGTRSPTRTPKKVAQAKDKNSTKSDHLSQVY